MDDFIELTRAESMSIAHDRLNLADLLREAADDFWASAQARGMTLEVHAPMAVAWAYGDQALIMRAIGNLVDNAIKYSPDGSSIQLSIQGDAGDWTIRIADVGPGIAPEDQPRLFQPFFRTSEAHRSGTGGAGLGLAFVHTVAQRHGGQVSVDSSPGQGSTFMLSLPMLLDDDAYED